VDIETELFEGGVDVFDDFLGENVGFGETVGFFEAFVSDPENIEAGFITIEATKSCHLAVKMRKKPASPRYFPLRGFPRRPIDRLPNDSR